MIISYKTYTDTYIDVSINSVEVSVFMIILGIYFVIVPVNALRYVISFVFNTTIFFDR